MIVDDFFPSSGGIGRAVQTQLEELSAMGHEVTLVVPDRFLEKPRIGRVIETPTMYLTGLPAHLSILHHSDRRARAIAGNAKFDIVHTHTERGGLILGAKIAKLQGIPHLHSFHANIAGTHQTVRAAVLGTLLYQALIIPMLRRAAGRAHRAPSLPSMRDETGGVFARLDWAGFAAIAGQVDGYTVPSPFMRDLIDGCSRDPLAGYVVPTGVNRVMLGAIADQPRERSHGPTRFISVGRLAKEKRLDVLLRAFRRADLPDAELVFVGDGDQRSKLKRLADGLPVDFRGHVPSVRRIAYELVNADALVLASYRFDSQALVIAEAVAAGLPVLYCDDRLTVGLSNESALLTGPDVKSLARGFRKLDDRARRERMSGATADLLPGLMPERTAEAIVATYEELIERKSRG
jgi:1,2-diacylglycerol 3-alpha-glucosyltransferase